MHSWLERLKQQSPMGAWPKPGAWTGEPGTASVPGALLGTLLYPLGLDAFVWRYVGLGIDGVMWAARAIGSWPGSTIHLPAFAPWAIVFLSLAVLSSVLWRTAILRATALPLAALGLLGAAAGPSFDMAVAPAGDA